MSLVTKPSGIRSTDTAVGLQQVFIGFANFYRRVIQGFSRIATPLTAMLKTTGSSVASASRVDDDEVVDGGGGAGAESGRSVGGSDASRKKSTKSKSQTKSGLNCTEYPEARKVSTHPVDLKELALLPRKLLQRSQYADFADVFSPNLASKLPKHAEINDYPIDLAFQVTRWRSKHCSSAKRTVAFDCTSEISIT